MTTMTGDDAPTHYDRVGAEVGIRKLVDVFYDLVLGDEELQRYFVDERGGGVNIRALKEHQVRLLSQLLGGPVTYDGRELADAHRHLGLSVRDLGRVGDYLLAALLTCHAPWDTVVAVRAVLLGVADDWALMGVTEER